MLKNKFGMLKVLALALSVLMLVSLAACGNKGVAEEDMNAAIQAALSEQAAADASKQAALESSLAAAQAAAESERKAVESSLAAAAAEASKAAAEASKAAAEAEKKASEEASKAAAEASKAAASASKALEEATRTTTTKATETTAPIVKDDLTAVQIKFAEKKHEYLVTKASYYLASDYAELALLFDKAAIELQNAMTVAAAENVLVTLEADIADVKNVLTDAAAVQDLIVGLGDVETDVVTTVLDKKNEAEEALVQLIYDYYKYFGFEFSDSDKDIEEIEITELSDVIVEQVEDLGVDIADLIKAEAKIAVLKNYVKAGLKEKIRVLYLAFEDNFDEDGDDLFVSENVKAPCYETIADGYYLYQVLSVVNGGDVAEADLAIDWEWLRDDEGDKVEQADLTEKPNAKQYVHPLTKQNYAAGDDIYDEDAPIDWFTAEQFMEIFATPYLNQELQYTIDAALMDLEAKLDPMTGVAAVYTDIKAKIDADLITPDENDTKITYIASEKDAELDDIFGEFEDAMEALTFVGDYKGNATLADAQLDVWTKYVEAYIAAGNAIVNASKAVAEEVVLEWYEGEVDYYNDYYEDKTGATAVANLAAKLENLAVKKDAYLANIEAAPNYTYADLFDLELIEDYAAQNGYDEDDADWDLADLLTVNGPKAELYAYINAVIADAMNDNFATTSKSTGTDQVGVLADLVEAMTDDLLALRDRLDPTNKNADLYQANTGRLNVTLQETAELEGYIVPEEQADGSIKYVEGYYANIPVFLDLMAQIDATIEAMQAIDETTYENKDVTLKTCKDNSTNKKAYGSKNVNKSVYWLNETARDLALEKWDEQGKLEGAINTMLKTEAKRLMSDGTKYDKIPQITMAEYVTLTNTGLPVTYVYTATEQACMAARDLYNTMYTNMHAKVMELNGRVGSYKNTIAGLVDKADNLTTTNAALTAEIAAFGELYKGYGDTYSALKYAFNATPGTASYVNAFSKSDYLTSSGNHISNSTKTVGNNAKKYADDGVQDDLNEYLALFKATFGATATENKVIDLWSYKTDMLAKLNEIKALYKNEYKTAQKVVDGYMQTVTEKTSATMGFKYDTTEAEKSSTKGAAYEAQVDALFDSYIAKIEAVTLNTVAQVKNYKDVEIIAKYGATNYNLDGSVDEDGAATFTEEEKFEKVTYNLAYAKSLIDAYVIDLVGYNTATTKLGDMNLVYGVKTEIQDVDGEPTEVVVNANTPVKDLTGNAVDINATKIYTTTDDSDSRIYKAWNVYYNGVYN